MPAFTPEQEAEMRRRFRALASGPAYTTPTPIYNEQSSQSWDELPQTYQTSYTTSIVTTGDRITSPGRIIGFTLGGAAVGAGVQVIRKQEKKEVGKGALLGAAAGLGVHIVSSVLGGLMAR